MKYNLYGDYWYFNGKYSPVIVRIIDKNPLPRIPRAYLVMDRKGKEFTTISGYLYRNHEIKSAVYDHAQDLMAWSNNYTGDKQGQGLNHKPVNIILESMLKGRQQ